MTNFAAFYLIQRFFYRIFIFLENWYVGSARFILRETILVLERLDQTFALRATLSHFFQPLYQDYSPIGYILGFLFRTSRTVVGAFVYGVVVIFAIALYVGWACIPLYTLFL